MNTRISIFIVVILVFSIGCKVRKKAPVNFKRQGSLDSRMVPNVLQSVGPFGAPLPMAEKGEWSAHGTGRFECIDVNPDNENEILLGHATSGLFKTTDGGSTWQQKFNFNFATGIFDILRFRKNSKHLLACCATDIGIEKVYGFGLVESFDGGETWQRNSLQYNPYEYNLKQQRGIAIADRRSEQRLVSISNHEIYITKDGGNSWNIVYSTKENLKSIKVNPNDDKTIIVTGNVFLVSTDGGDSWQDKTAMLCSAYGTVPSAFARYEVVFSEKTTNQLWIAVSHNSSYMLQIDAAYFNDFKLVSKSQFTGNIYHMAMASSFNRRLNTEQLFVATTRLFKSTNEGVSFKQVTSPENGMPNNVHDDVNTIKVTNAGKIYITTDGGADCSNDEGHTWMSLTNGSADLNGSLMFGFDKAKNGCMMAGTQDKGIFIFKNDSWFSSNMYGDGGRVVALNDSNAFACGFQKMCYKTTDGGKTFNYNHAGGDINFFDFKMDYTRRTGALYITNQHLYKQEKGKNFEILSSDLAPERPIGALWVNPENPDEIWLSKMDATWGGPLVKKLYFTNDGGINWQDKTEALPILKWRPIMDICVNQNGDIAVALGGFDSDKGDINKVYLSTDGGNTFENISEGLGNFPVNTIVSIGNQWVCGNTNGVYIKNRGEAWQALSTDFPPTIISQLKYFEDEKVLYAATFGRGLWRILLN